MRIFALMLTVLLLVAVSAVVGTTRAVADEAMSFDTYKQKIWNQLHWTNRAQANRCRPKFTIDEFTKTPLSDVLPSWRDDHVRWAKNRHHRAQEKSSLCQSDTLMDWYYTSGAKCVREHEGAWNSNTGNGYYGGFQADLSFQSTYNYTAYKTYGTADKWPIIEQIKMAHNGWRARGWYPWPTTARICGLI